MSKLSLYFNVPYRFEKQIFKDLQVYTKQFINSFRNNNSNLETITIFFLFFFFKKINPAQIYHFVRAQSLMKLYVIFGFLDVCEKLITTILKDIIDDLKEELKKGELKKNFKNQSGNELFLCKIFLISLYVFFTALHTLVLYAQYAALHVCVNSHVNVLYTLLISVNFVEIRSNIFRKFSNEGAVFMYDADLVKRFYMLLNLLIIFIYNNIENCDNKKYALIFPILLIYLTKVCVEWIKHIFICRLSEIDNINYRIIENYRFVGGNIVFLCLMWHIIGKELFFALCFLLCQ
ncbi:hypothetical protein GVAV_002594 [Gurleya vavrai]